jgi:hypothetical protein
LSEECGASWHDSEEFRLVWRQAYDNMMKFYVNKVMYYGDKFMESPAGIALKTTLDKSRKRHGALPAVNEETLLNIRARTASVGPSVRWPISFKSFQNIPLRRRFKDRYDLKNCHLINLIDYQGYGRRRVVRI